MVDLCKSSFHNQLNNYKADVIWKLNAMIRKTTKYFSEIIQSPTSHTDTYSLKYVLYIIVSISPRSFKINI